MIAAVQALGIHVLAEGILTRGAVVHGPAYHNGSVLFGPGIIEAYAMEREVAKYPRILVSESVRKSVWDYHKDLWQGQLLKQDVDGCWFVNLLVPSASSWAALSALELDEENHLIKVRQALVGAWTGPRGNAGHMSKVWRLIHRFNKIAREQGVAEIENEKK